MHSKLFSSTLVGLEGYPVEIEADVSQGLPSFTIVGLPDTSVQESRERIRAAINNSKLPFPRTRVTINLAPADLKKEGSYFDVPIALALLFETLKECSTFKISSSDLIVGELALNGNIREIRGALSVALLAKEKGFKRLIIPYKNVEEASLIPNISVIGVKTLRDAVDFLSGKESSGVKRGIYKDSLSRVIHSKIFDNDFSHIYGQEHVKRAFEIAAAGGHNIAMVGSPGAGKTMLAKAFTSVLPDLTRTEVIELTRLYSAAGVLKENTLVYERPFRAPHHSASVPALVGGGTTAKPGEISLAHRGVLFLDEAAEFQKNVLESLRQPLEDGSITVSRIYDSIKYPSRFMLVLATNPCPCGYYQDEHHECTCTIGQVQKYHKKLSGPLLDRIDMHLQVPAVDVTELSKRSERETSDIIKKRVESARRRQKENLKDYNINMNAELPTSVLHDHSQITSEAKNFLKKAARTLNLSARSYYRVLKLSLTISDLGGSDTVTEEHVAEALTYRPQNFLDL